MNNYYYSDIDDKSANIGDEIDSLAIKNASKIIVPSKWAYNSIAQDYLQNMNKVSLIHFGSNMPFFNSAPRTLNNKAVINLLLVGVEWKRKGVDIALETVKLLNKDSTKQYILTIVGLDKPKDFKQENVNFKGKLNKNDEKELKLLQEEYKKADFFIMPTKAEAAGIVFAEAAMYGIPTITYKTGGVSDYVLDNKTGYTLESNNSAK